MTPDVVKSMENAIKNAASKVFPTGHATAIEDPEGFNKTVIDFMKQV